ncbi:MAG TPA: riboflavin synthase [Candidatus Angelobacter sp.]
MFTGLVQETGRIEGIERRKEKNGAELTRITVTAHDVPGALKSGDSVAVSGVCLTAVETGTQHFCADLAEETLRRTSLGELRRGSLVNLELPARPQDRLGGHIVQGHVDGTGKLISLRQIQGREDWRLVVELPSQLTKYVVSQGSITLEGISLTVAWIEGARLEVAIIPHTHRATNLHALRPGNQVNIEVDILAKYVEKMVRGEGASKLSVATLMKQGF